MNILKWLPVWAHIFVSIMMIAIHNFIAAWLAGTAAFFAFCWIIDAPKYKGK